MPRAPSARSATPRRTASRRRSGPSASRSPARCSGSASTGTSRAPRCVEPGRERVGGVVGEPPLRLQREPRGREQADRREMRRQRPERRRRRMRGRQREHDRRAVRPRLRQPGRLVAAPADAAVAPSASARARARQVAFAANATWRPQAPYPARETSGADAAIASSSRSNSCRGVSVGTISKRAMRIGSVSFVSRPNVVWPSSLKPRL